MQYLKNRWLTLRNSFFHKLKFSQTLFWLLLLFAISSLSKTQSLQSSTITSWFLLTLTVQVNPQKEKISAAQQKMVAILNSIYNFGVPSWKNLFIISRTYVLNIFSRSLKKTCHQRNLRQTKCLLFKFWMIKFTFIPKKDIWHLPIYQNWCFGQFYYSNSLKIMLATIFFPTVPCKLCP